MKTLLCLSLLFAVTVHSAEETPLTVAVLAFDGPEEARKSPDGSVGDLLGAYLSAQPQFWVVERTQIDALLAEQTIGLSNLADPATAARVGKILGAKVLITGRVIPTGGQKLIVAKIISTETSRVFGETVRAGNELAEPIQELAGKVGAVLSKHAAVFRPVVVTREDRVAALHKVVQGDKRTVRVHIEEREIGRQVIDPAAQTEVEKTLLELGFAIWNPNGDVPQPSLQILGEAFSEPGARRGQLVSTRGRVEIKVTDAKGTVLASDSQTATAVDIAEAVAGKRALEDAAFTLIERIAPKL
jgi:hypothetical protein